VLLTLPVKMTDQHATWLVFGTTIKCNLHRPVVYTYLKYRILQVYMQTSSLKY